MSKTTDTMILCTRCGSPHYSLDDSCQRCGLERFATHKCDFCGDTVTRRVYETLRICLPCAKSELEGLAYRYATLDANIKMLEEL